MGALTSPPPSRKRPSRAVMIGTLAVLTGLVVWRMAGDDGESQAGVPPLKFRIATVKAAGIGSEPDASAAEAVSPEIERLMKDYYSEAFLDPENWRNGNFDSVWKLFRPTAAEAAKARVAEVTAGTDAAERYASIMPGPSLLGIRVLTDKKGEPVSAFALATFVADAETTDGSPVRIVSEGRFALDPNGDGWHISGFRVDTQERGAGASPVPPSGTEVGRAHAAAESFPAYDGEGAFNVLVIGDSYREGQSHLADSIHVVSINPETGGGTVLGIPRDSWVTVPGHGESKINEAFARGGSDLMVQTVEDVTGLEMDYYAVTTFEGFKSLVKGVGGLDIKIPYAIHDEGSKANLSKGRTRLSGKDALRFARSRYDVPNGDFSRQHNEGIILLALLEQFRDSFREEPSVVVNWLSAAMSNIESDLSLDQVAALAYLGSRIDPRKVDNIVAPAKYGAEKGQSVVRIEPEAQEIFDDMADNGVLDQEHEGADV